MQPAVGRSRFLSSGALVLLGLLASCRTDDGKARCTAGVDDTGDPCNVLQAPSARFADVATAWTSPNSSARIGGAIAVADIDGVPGAEILVDAGTEHFVAVLDGQGGSIEDAPRRWSGGIAGVINTADLDGDGRQDAVLSSTESHDGDPASPPSDTAYGWTGELATTMPVLDAAVQLQPEQGGYRKAACTGDWDGDGIQDYADILEVETEIFLGPLGAGVRAPDVTIQQRNALESNGPRCVGNGDLDGDGRPDLALTDAVNGDAGGGFVGVFTALPADGAQLSDAEIVLSGDHPYDMFGSSMVAGDVDGDGRDDLVVGAPGADGNGDYAGELSMFRGPVAGGGPSEASLRVVGEAENIGLGTTAAIGDGWLASSGRGVADPCLTIPVVFLLDSTWTGDHTTAEALRVFTGDLEDWDGARLAAGDVDDDGRQDLVAADYQSYFGAMASGVVFVVSASQLVAEPL